MRHETVSGAPPASAPNQHPGLAPADVRVKDDVSMAPQGECANCGRDLPITEPHRKGRNRYCSYACFVEASSLPRRRRRMPWALVGKIALALVAASALVVGFLALRSAVDATPKKATATAPRRHRAPGAKLVLGSRGRPVPIGKMVSIGGYWRLEVVSTTPDVSRVALGIGNAPLLPPGSETYLVKVKLRYLGHVKREKALAAIVAINAFGSHHGYYNANDQCNPPPRLNFRYGGAAKIRNSKPLLGTLCFLIASKDAANLKLYAYPPDAPGFRAPTRRTWFSLG